MHETQPCTCAHFASLNLRLNYMVSSRPVHWRHAGHCFSSLTVVSSFESHLVWLSLQTCQSFLPCSMVGHNEPTSIPLFCLRLQTRILSLDSFVDQCPLFLCVIFHLDIFRTNILCWIWNSSHGSNSTSRIEREHTSIETSLSLFLKSWSSPSCFFCSSVSTSDPCGSWETSETSYERQQTQTFNVCSPKSFTSLIIYTQRHELCPVVSRHV